MSNSPEEFRYWAFISYSSKDEATAKKLHKSLETYRIPRDLRGRKGRDGPVPKKLFPIFRDRDELPLSSDLGGTVKDALFASRYLIVICSPNSAQSRWVNEEIAYFKSLGRENRILAVILDGEPNASDNSESQLQECFPPALRFKVNDDGELTNRRVEPIGGDLRESGDGWTNVILKAVAGITGLGYDTFVRREQKRQRVRRGALMAAVLILLIAGYWTWDYYRIKTDYYANVVTVWSLPVGIAELDEKLRDGRQFHYRLKSSERKVRRVERINSAGTLQDDENEHGASMWEMFYDEEGDLSRIDLRDHNKKHLLRKEFGKVNNSSNTPFRFVKFVQQYNEAPLAMSNRIGQLTTLADGNDENKSGITSQRIQYDEQGRVIDRIYYDASRTEPVANSEGVYGQHFSYIERTQPIRIENLGSDGKPAEYKGQIVGLELDYTALGDTRSRYYLDANNQPMSSSNDVAGSVVERNDFGNIKVGMYYGVNDEPVKNNKGGYHLWRQTFNEQGNRTSQSYYDINQQPVLHTILEAHSVKQRYNDKGRMIEQAYYGIYGNKIIRPDLGYHKVKQEYEEGNVSGYRFYGINDQPVLRSDIGAHFISVNTDSSGNLSEQAYYGTKGEQVLHKKYGYHMWKQTYDKRGNVEEIAYFGINGNPVLRTDLGIHSWKAGYNKTGNRDLEIYYDTNNKPTTRKDLDFHGLSRIYDNQGNLKEIAYFGTDKKIISYFCVKTNQAKPCPF